MRIPPSESSPSSWREYKERGKSQFTAERYEEALSSYRAALNPELSCPAAERQVLLSNVVACRLKIGGSAMASAAVEEAKQCIALNERWAKGHVRLASAYIASGGHSNDACNSLQRALALDPSNATARQMLLRELRRDRAQRTSENGTNEINSTSRVEPSAPPVDLGDGEDTPFSPSSVNPSYVPPTHGANPSVPPPDDYMGDTNSRANDAPRAFQDNIDESPTLSERMQFYLARVTTWYEHGISEDTRTLLKVMVGLLVLYVAFGGRFGLDSVLGGDKGNRGNYDYGNAYDRYYSRSNAGAADTGSSSGYNDRTTGRYSSNSYGQSGRRTTYDDFYTPPRSSRPGSSNSYHVPNLFDGSLPSILILVAIAFTCHHFGINPFHALWMLNIFTGNRGRGMHRMGMMGMGYGMMNNHMRFGRRGMRRGG